MGQFTSIHVSERGLLTIFGSWRLLVAIQLVAFISNIRGLSYLARLMLSIHAIAEAMEAHMTLGKSQRVAQLIAVVEEADSVNKVSSAIEALDSAEAAMDALDELDQIFAELDTENRFVSLISNSDKESAA